MPESSNLVYEFFDTTTLQTAAFSSSIITIYPNPTIDIFHIDLENELSGKITDLTGKTLLHINSYIQVINATF